jgi:hypothetical protein
VKESKVERGRRALLFCDPRVLNLNGHRPLNENLPPSIYKKITFFPLLFNFSLLLFVQFYTSTTQCIAVNFQWMQIYFILFHFI